MTLWSYQAHMTTTSIKWNQYLAEPLSNYSRDVRAQHRIRGCIVCCRRCGGLTQPSLSTHTARIPTAAGSVLSKQRARRWLKKKIKKKNFEETHSLITWPWRRARWLTAFSRHTVGEGFHLLPHSKFMLLKHIMDHFSQSLGSTGHKATLWSAWCLGAVWHFTTSQLGVCCRWPGSQTAKSICQLKTTGVLGASGLPFGRRAK